ncbi:MAG: glycosyltransferase [bacterium]
MDNPLASKIRNSSFKVCNRLLIPDGVIGWLPFALKKAHEIVKENEIEAIYVTGNPFSCFLIGAFLKKKTNRKLVLDYRDPWNINPLNKRGVIGSLLERKLERFAVSLADLIILNTRRSCIQYKEQFSHSTDAAFITIENAYDEELEDFFVSDERVKEEDVFTIFYAGNFYGSRNPEKFFEALHLIIKRMPALKNKIQFHYFGLNKESQFHNQIHSLGIHEVVRFHASVPIRKLISSYRIADILLLINHLDEGNSLFIPQKFFEYLMTEKPILCLSKEGALKDIVHETRSGTCADPENAEEIAQKIIDCYNKYYINKEKLKIVGKQNYSSLEQTKRLCYYLDSIALNQ